ncbi:hypothetical protein HJG60_009411 [Phyllostomus discolor]|uniref:Uncharacterized protein n=1 Tax=Phyllostomus discolor TaxID=89673 RepID=A0A834D8W5_9CHIR|nr:hypothetical protein HJG60_009411 [Phyllostomus discolor]
MRTENGPLCVSAHSVCHPAKCVPEGGPCDGSLGFGGVRPLVSWEPIRRRQVSGTTIEQHPRPPGSGAGDAQAVRVVRAAWQASSFKVLPADSAGRRAPEGEHGTRHVSTVVLGQSRPSGADICENALVCLKIQDVRLSGWAVARAVKERTKQRRCREEKFLFSLSPGRARAGCGGVPRP